MDMDMDMVDKNTLSLFIPHDKTAENKRKKVETGMFADHDVNSVSS